jgi:GT2 family glycosyltransferase
MSEQDPSLSVIIATYNRCEVLRCAIASVMASEFTDFELIVVGDHCTDATPEVVAAFGDARVRFINLAENCGDQSGPNNVGLESARGRYIAFLNHDDLWFPDHAGRSIAALEEDDADFVWSPLLVAEPRTADELRRRRWRAHLGLVPQDGVYDPFLSCLASTWVLRRDLAKRIGPWRAAHTLHLNPSADWMFRIWRAGARMHFSPQVSVLVVLSGDRGGSYAQSDSPEHLVYLDQMRESPRFRESLLEGTCVRSAMRTTLWGEGRPGKIVLRALARLLAPLARSCARLGLHPKVPYLMLRYGRGGSVGRHRRIVGLGPLPRNIQPRPGEPAGGP